MKHTSGFFGLVSDFVSLFQEGPASPEVDVSRHAVLQALVAAPMVLMLDPGIDLLPVITWRPSFFSSKQRAMQSVASNAKPVHITQQL